MARLSAAAGLVCAIVFLVSVGLGAGQPFAAWFPSGSLPPPVGIYCRENASVNVAVRGGDVVLATADCSDWSQKWYPLYTLSSFSGPIELKPFALQNAETFQVITIPSRSGQKVGLSSPLDVARARDQLWTPEKLTRADGFYQLFVTGNNALTLNGLLGGVHDGTEVGVYSASPNSWNALWQITSSPPC